MSASADDIMRAIGGLMNGQSTPQTGLLGALNQALAPYGGTMGLSTALLANKSGGSSFGSILGQSLEGAQQQTLDNQAKKLQLAQQTLQMPQALYRLSLMNKLSGAGAPGTAAPSGQPFGSGPQSPGQPMPSGSQQGGATGALQEGQRPGLPAPQERQPPSAPTPFDVPGMGIDELPVSGYSPQQARAAVQLFGKDIDPATAGETVHKLQQQGALAKIAQPTALLSSIINSDDPTRYVDANPQMKQWWNQNASRFGMDPQAGFTPNNVRTAFAMQRNALLGWAQQPAAEMPDPTDTVTLPDGRQAQLDRRSGKLTVLPDADLQQVIGPNGQPTLVPRSKAAGMTPFNASVFGASNMTDQAIQFAADTYRSTGKMPPAFARNPMAQAKVLDRVASDAAANGDTPGAVAARTASLKANGQALDQVTKLQTATSGYAATLDKNLTNLQQSYSKIDSSGSPLINRALRIWQQGGTGDAQTADMVVWLNAVQGEYAKLKSGNLGNAPASDASMRDAKEVINKYMNQGGIQAVASAMRAEAQNRMQAINEQKTGLTGALGTNAPTSAPAAHPADIQALLRQYGQPTP